MVGYNNAVIAFVMLSDNKIFELIFFPGVAIVPALKYLFNNLRLKQKAEYLDIRKTWDIWTLVISHSLIISWSFLTKV